MTKEEIKQAWSESVKVQFHQIEKGIDSDGWYSNERNDAWMPMAAIIDWSQMEFRNNRTELRPIALNWKNRVS